MRANKLETALSRDHNIACLAPPDMVFFMYMNHMDFIRMNLLLNTFVESPYITAVVHSSLPVCAPKNWVKGKLLGSGAFGQVRETHFLPYTHGDMCDVLCLFKFQPSYQGSCLSPPHPSLSRCSSVMILTLAWRWL